jgi:hypothetical protein
MKHNKILILSGVVYEVVELQEMGWGHGLVASTCECGNEPSVSIQRGEFLD